MTGSFRVSRFVTVCVCGPAFSVCMGVSASFSIGFGVSDFSVSFIISVFVSVSGIVF